MNKCYMHNIKDDTHKLIKDFEIQTDLLISARQTYQEIVIKKSYQIVGVPLPADHRVKLKESEKRDKYFYLAREQKNRFLSLRVFGL